MDFLKRLPTDHAWSLSEDIAWLWARLLHRQQRQRYVKAEAKWVRTDASDSLNPCSQLGCSSLVAHDLTAPCNLNILSFCLFPSVTLPLPFSNMHPFVHDLYMSCYYEWILN